MVEYPPIVVAGMHRSGTSMTASLLAALGVDLGPDVIPPDELNPRGYFEDSAVVRLHQRMLQAASPTDDGGHPDWGWTESEQLDRAAFASFEAEASTLIAARHRYERPWGFKDPRTSVALEFWDRLLGERARYLFVYRWPWEVADSMQRLGAGVFLRNPSYGVRIWTFYNRQVLDFYLRHRDRSLLLCANELVKSPGRLVDLLAERFGIECSSEALRDVCNPLELRSRPAADPIARRTIQVYPQLRDLLPRLEREADLPSSEGLPDGGTTRAAAVRAMPSSGVASPRGGVGSAESATVSIVLPCLDHGEFLIDALASVERSITVPYELVVVDDGSTAPETLRILDLLRADGCRVLRQENRGLAAARNAGIEHLSGRYVLPLDADNRILPGFVERAVSRLDENPEIGVVYGDRVEFGLRRGRVHVADFDVAELLWRNYIDACAVFRRQVWLDVGGYEDGMAIWEDWDFWLGAIGAGWGFVHLDLEAFDYRVRPDSLLSGAADPAIAQPVQRTVIQKHADLYHRRLPELMNIAWSRSS